MLNIQMQINDDYFGFLFHLFVIKNMPSNAAILGTKKEAKQSNKIKPRNKGPLLCLQVSQCRVVSAVLEVYVYNWDFWMPFEGSQQTFFSFSFSPFLSYFVWIVFFVNFILLDSFSVCLVIHVLNPMPSSFHKKI